MTKIEDIIRSNSNGLAMILAKAGLWCASQPYAGIVGIRNWLYDRKIKKCVDVEIPVISVGNITAGGTGKTPTVAFLAKWFRAREIRVAILSRGYGAGADGLNDEAKELEHALADVPHLQSPDRILSARIAIDELDMQILLLDDGFQHRKIARNLEIVLLDSKEPWGYGYLLPRGLLREPLRSLKRADIVIATRADQVETQKLAEIRSKVQRYNPKAAWVEARHAPIRLRNSQGAIRDLNWLVQRKVCCVSGIGNPNAFHQTIQMCGAEILKTFVYPDHHNYNAIDIRSISEIVSDLNTCDAILCTGKDFSKLDLPRIGTQELWCLDIELEIVSGLDSLEDRLKEVLRHQSVRGSMVQS